MHYVLFYAVDQGIFNEYHKQHQEISEDYFILIRVRLRCTLAFWRNKGIQEIFLETVKKFPAKEAIYDVTLGKSFTFTELDQMACRYAHMIQKHSSVKPGDVVAIFMENGVDFVAAWLACAKIGVISAWINTNLRAESLTQSLANSKASVVLCSASLQQALMEVTESNAAHSMQPLLIFSRGSSNKLHIKLIDKLLLEQPSSQPTTHRQMTFQGKSSDDE
ncbi:hypothetical protein OSTOST_01480 [Ostertagia ostertagi]